MEWYEIVLIILIASFVCFIFGRMIYDKIKKKPSTECSCCKSNMQRSLKMAKKELCNLKSK